MWVWIPKDERLAIKVNRKAWCTWCPEKISIFTSKHSSTPNYYGSWVLEVPGWGLGITPRGSCMYVTSFSSITYYSNLDWSQIWTSTSEYQTTIHIIWINSFNSRLRFNSVVVQDWYQSVPVRSTLSPDPYPHSNRGQTLGTHRSCPPFHNMYTLQKSPYKQAYYLSK